MMNDDLQRVQIGRDKDVPIETHRGLWFLWIYEDGSWDADAITRASSIASTLEKRTPKEIFCIWQGQYRTNLFLMEIKPLIKRLKSI